MLGRRFQLKDPAHGNVLFKYKLCPSFQAKVLYYFCPNASKAVMLSG